MLLPMNNNRKDILKEDLWSEANL